MEIIVIRVKNKDLKCVRGNGYIKEEMDWWDMSSEAHSPDPTAVPGVWTGVSMSKLGSPASPFSNHSVPEEPSGTNKT